MSLHHPDIAELAPYAPIINHRTSETGLYIGVTDDGRVLFWPDGGDGADEIDPADVLVSEVPQ